MSAGRSPLLVLLGTVLVGLGLIGSGLAMTTVAPRATAPDIVAPPTAVVATSAAAPPVSGVASTGSGEPVVAAPVTLSLPGGADVPLVPVGVLASGALQLPDLPSTVGWYADGAVPGDDVGTAVVAGHVDSARFGVGPLARLRDLRAGDVLQVRDAAGTAHRFAVVSRTSYPKSALPAETFRRDGPPRLAAITCGGAFDRARGHYADNVVVLATPV